MSIAAYKFRKSRIGLTIDGIITGSFTGIIVWLVWVYISPWLILFALVGGYIVGSIIIFTFVEFIAGPIYDEIDFWLFVRKARRKEK